MAKFTKGSIANPKGRGSSPNRVTAKVRALIGDIIEANLDKLQADLDALEPKARIDALTKLLKFVAPTLTSIALDDTEVKTATEHLQAIASWTDEMRRPTIADATEN